MCGESSQSHSLSFSFAQRVVHSKCYGQHCHDPFSKTAQSSFHGTDSNLTQFPTADDMGTAIESVATVEIERLDLPHSYTIVPAVALNQSKAEVVQRSCVETFCGNFEKAIQKENVWLKNAVEKSCNILLMSTNR